MDQNTSTNGQPIEAPLPETTLPTQPQTETEDTQQSLADPLPDLTESLIEIER